MKQFSLRLRLRNLLASVSLIGLLACQPQPSMTVYTYISPGSAKLLERQKMTQAELVSYLEQQLKQYRLYAVAPNAVFEGSSDALRLDLRRTQDQLKIELSVRQGVSANNMLERWSQVRWVSLPEQGDDAALRRRIYLALDQLLKDLQQQYGQAAYMQGQPLNNE